MADVSIVLGTASARLGAELLLDADGAPVSPGLPFTEHVSAYDMGSWVVVDGQPARDHETGANLGTQAGAEDSTVVTAPLDRLTIFPDAYAHWVPGPEYMAWHATEPLYRWWPIQTNDTRLDTDPRMSLFKQEREEDPIVTGMKPYGDGIGAPTLDTSYTYQGFGAQITGQAMCFESRGFCKLDAERPLGGITFAVTAVYHPSELPYYGIFEAAQEGHEDSNVPLGDPLVIRWHHNQLRIYHNDELVLTHESHRAPAEPVILMLSFDPVTDIGRMLVVDGNRTTRTFNVEGFEVGFVGIFGGLGQGVVGDPYNVYTADMDVLDVCLWDSAMDWPELNSKANLLALTYGVGV